MIGLPVHPGLLPVATQQSHWQFRQPQALQVDAVDRLSTRAFFHTIVEFT